MNTGTSTERSRHQRRHNMSCVINPVTQDQCVFLTYEGEISPVEIMAARYEANAVLSKRHWSRIVLDIRRLKFPLNCRALLELTSGVSMVLPHKVQVALLAKPEQIHRANFSANLVRTGGVSLTNFSDAQQAWTWARGIEHADKSEITFVTGRNITNNNDSPTKTTNENTTNHHIIRRRANLCLVLARPLRPNGQRRSTYSRA
jgi:hypothetical protein